VRIEARAGAAMAGCELDERRGYRRGGSCGVRAAQDAPRRGMSRPVTSAPGQPIPGSIRAASRYVKQEFAPKQGTNG